MLFIKRICGSLVTLHIFVWFCLGWLSLGTVAKCLLGFLSGRRPLSFHTPSLPLPSRRRPKIIHTYTWKICFPGETGGLHSLFPYIYECVFLLFSFLFSICLEASALRSLFQILFPSFLLIGFHSPHNNLSLNLNWHQHEQSLILSERPRWPLHLTNNQPFLN